MTFVVNWNYTSKDWLTAWLIDWLISGDLGTISYRVRVKPKYDRFVTLTKWNQRISTVLSQDAIENWVWRNTELQPVYELQKANIANIYWGDLVVGFQNLCPAFIIQRTHSQRNVMFQCSQGGRSFSQQTFWLATAGMPDRPAFL